MADERCPLCLERLKHGECISCGYKLPDEDNISSVYDYEPSEYPQPEPVIREITPEVQMEEIYPNRDNVPKFKVRDDNGQTVKANAKVDLNKKRSRTNNKSGSDNGKHYADHSNSHAGNNNRRTSNNPYAGYTPEGVPNKTRSPFANPSANTPVESDSIQAFIKRYWWLLLLSFFVPILGIILYSTMKSELKLYKASYLVIIAVVLGFVLPPL